MSQDKALIIALCLVPGIVAFIELFLRLPFLKYLNALRVDSAKALSIISSSKISDHWKEKVIPRYARNILCSSLLMAVFLFIFVMAFAAVYGLSGVLFLKEVNSVISLLYQIDVQIIAIAIGVLYGFLRVRIQTITKKNKGDYTFFSKTLHYIALNFRPIKEVAFDMDCLASRRFQEALLESPPPVYVSGLARAGTTILLEALFSTGVFTTFTYRDMPFVTAPYLWRMITKGQHRKSKLRERAHGDGLYVNYDSPEAFEEIFWNTFAGEGYIKESYLKLQVIDTELTEKYRRFVGNIIGGSGQTIPLRYLAKNNNNLLRIGGIKSAFPDASIIVPFRDPTDHAQSLLRQHRRFLEIHSADAFSLKYMNWLGHFEFGKNFKPFKVSSEALPINEEETDKVDYWLRYWKCVYEYVIENHTANVIFFNYDNFCAQPDKVIEQLADRLSLDLTLIKPFSAKVKAPKKYDYAEGESTSPAPINSVYETLKELSI